MQISGCSVYVYLNVGNLVNIYDRAVVTCTSFNADNIIDKCTAMLAIKKLNQYFHPYAYGVFYIKNGILYLHKM